MRQGTRWTTIRRTGAAALAVGMCAFGIVAVSAPTAHAAARACQQTYTSNTDVAIPDHDGLDEGYLETQGLDVPEGLVVADVNASVNVTHAFAREVSVLLISRTDAFSFRESSFLVDHVAGNGGQNFVGTVLDDQAAIPLNWGTAPFTGSFKPIDQLAAHNGEVGGRYNLALYDRAAGDAGVLESWSITLTYVTCDFDSDGVEDHKDSCRGITAATATGCPLTTRTLTSTYSSGKFKGRVSSPVAGCKAGRPVTIWKSVTGPDRKIGTATSRSDGTYGLSRTRRVGRYYATTPLSVVANQAQCPAARSATFRIR